jgi:hypothetical protein
VEIWAPPRYNISPQARGGAKSLGHYNPTFLNTEILDVDTILGIVREAPVFSTIAQRMVPTEIPECPKNPKRRSTRRIEAEKVRHRKKEWKQIQRLEVKQLKAKYQAKKKNEMEEGKEKVRYHRNGLYDYTVKKSKAAYSGQIDLGMYSRFVKHPGGYDCWDPNLLS